jgi:hypothetical protein
VNYALRVDPGEALDDYEFWKASGIEPVFPEDEKLGCPFPADAMWSMIFEAGLIPERTVPRRRKSIGLVPDFGKIAALNGSYIATKVDALLTATFAGSIPRSVAFLCPAEDHARTLARALRGLAGRDTIHIDRAIIESFRKHPDRGLPSMRAEFPETYLALDVWRRLTFGVAPTERPQIVLLDEFNVSGGTFRGLFALASSFDLSVLCTMSLATYGSDVAPTSVPHLTLYRMGRPN